VEWLGPGFRDPNVRAWAEGRESSYVADVEKGRIAFFLWAQYLLMGTCGPVALHLNFAVIEVEYSFSRLTPPAPRPVRGGVDPLRLLLVSRQ